jgi:hypothetical protein
MSELKIAGLESSRSSCLNLGIVSLLSFFMLGADLVQFGADAVLPPVKRVVPKHGNNGLYMTYNTL